MSLPRLVRGICLGKFIFVPCVILTFAAFGVAKPKEREAPSWVTETATRAVPAYPGRVPAVVLLNEQKVTVDSTGMMTSVTRGAVKILTYEGKCEAQVIEGYKKAGVR